MLRCARENHPACTQHQRQAGKPQNTPVSPFLLPQSHQHPCRVQETGCRAPTASIFQTEYGKAAPPSAILWHTMPRNRFGHPVPQDHLFRGPSVLKHLAVRSGSCIRLFWMSSYSSKDFNSKAQATHVSHAAVTQSITLTMASSGGYKSEELFTWVSFHFLSFKMEWMSRKLWKHSPTSLHLSHIPDRSAVTRVFRGGGGMMEGPPWSQTGPSVRSLGTKVLQEPRRLGTMTNKG